MIIRRNEMLVMEKLIQNQSMLFRHGAKKMTKNISE